MRRVLVLLAACGSSAPPPPVTVAEPVHVDSAAEHKQRLEVAHHKLEDEQISAFQATCDAPHTRCEPSCYVGGPPDPRAGKKLAILPHWACEVAGGYAIVDEAGLLPTAPARLPRAPRKGSWEAKLGVRAFGSARPLIHPATHESLRCTPVAEASKPRALDVCAGHGEIACEAAGNPAAHGLDVVHYRLAEARRLHAAHDDAACERAATEAIAVSRGLPRWRQYLTLNVNKWPAFARYRTRADGVLDEDGLFERATALGLEAATACGGQLAPRTTAAHEQSFHTCW